MHIYNVFFRCKGTKTARKGHMKSHYVLWNMPSTGHCAHFLLPVWKILAHPTTIWPRPNLLASTLLGAMACAWHVLHSNGFQAL